MDQGAPRVRARSRQEPDCQAHGFYADKYDNDISGRKGMILETNKTEEVSPTLKCGVELISSGLI